MIVVLLLRKELMVHLKSLPVDLKKMQKHYMIASNIKLTMTMDGLAKLIS